MQKLSAELVGMQPCLVQPCIDDRRRLSRLSFRPPPPPPPRVLLLASSPSPHAPLPLLAPPPLLLVPASPSPSLTVLPCIPNGRLMAKHCRDICSCLAPTSHAVASPRATQSLLPLSSLMPQPQFTSPSTEARLWLNTHPSPPPTMPPLLFLCVTATPGRFLVPSK